MGFDNSLRIWDVPSMTMTSIFENPKAKEKKEQKINSVAWCPTDQDIVAIGTAIGVVHLVDIKKGKLL